MNCRVLYLTKHDPWGVGGGAVASGMYLGLLARVFSDARIDLCVADSCRIPAGGTPANINIIPVGPRGKVSKLLSPITGITHRFQDKALSLLGDNAYDFVVFDHSSLAGTLVDHLPDNIRSIVIHHNFEQDYFRDNTPSALHRKMLLPAVARNERKAYHRCSLSIFLTKEDEEQFASVYGRTSKATTVVGLVEDCAGYPAPSTPLKDRTPLTIAITGSLGNVQNIDGIRYFVSELYPQIPENINIIVAGKNPTAEIRSLLDLPRVKLIPNPPSMQPILETASIFLCPARLGGGIKVRVSDGLKAGLPVIAHEVSARGYGAFIKRGMLRSFSSPADFRQQLDNTIAAINSETLIAADIATAYRSETSVDTAADKLKAIIRSL